MSAVRQSWQHKAKVVWVANGKHHDVHECHGVSFPEARAYKRENKHSPQYVGGILCVVSMQAKAYQS